MRNLFKVLALVIFLVGCSNDNDGSVNVSNETLSGKVYGDTFTAKGGKAFDSGDKISVNITNIQADCNSNIFGYLHSISTYVNKEAGINTDANVIFKKKGEAAPLNVLGSTVIVESITDNEIVIKVKSESGSDNTIEGKFTVPYCKD